MWEKYAGLYAPMVTDNSLAYIELRDCAEILSPLDESIYASMFVNENVYLALSNLSGKPYVLKLSDKWRNRETNQVSDTFTVAHEKLLFLVKER